MLQRQTKACVLDLSGAGWVQLFHLYRGSYRRYAYSGDFVKGAVLRVAFYPRYIRGKRYRPIRVGHVVRGMVLHGRAASRFFDNTRCFFAKNAVVLLRRRNVLKTKFNTQVLPRLVRRQKYEALFGGFV